MHVIAVSAAAITTLTMHSWWPAGSLTSRICAKLSKSPETLLHYKLSYVQCSSLKVCKKPFDDSVSSCFLYWLEKVFNRDIQRHKFRSKIPYLSIFFHSLLPVLAISTKHTLLNDIIITRDYRMIFFCNHLRCILSHSLFFKGFVSIFNKWNSWESFRKLQQPYQPVSFSIYSFISLRITCTILNRFASVFVKKWTNKHGHFNVAPTDLDWMVRRMKTNIRMRGLKIRFNAVPIHHNKKGKLQMVVTSYSEPGIAWDRESHVSGLGSR